MAASGKPLEQLADNMKTLAENLKTLRTTKRMTRAQLAQKSRTSASTIQRIEEEKGNPEYDVLVSLANALEVTVAELVSAKAPDSGFTLSPGFGKTIERHRIKRELSREELARMIGVDPSTVYRWETEERQPDWLDAQKLAAALETSLRVLFLSDQQQVALGFDEALQLFVREHQELQRLRYESERLEFEIARLQELSALSDDERVLIHTYRQRTPGQRLLLLLFATKDKFFRDRLEEYLESATDREQQLIRADLSSIPRL